MNEELKKVLNNAQDLKSDLYFFEKKLENTNNEFKEHIKELKNLQERLETVLDNLYYEL